MRYGSLLISPVVFLALFIMLSGTAQGQSVTSFSIEIDTGGSALWSMEYNLVLSTPEDVEAWNQTYDGNNVEFLQKFQNDMVASVAWSEQETGRAMYPHDFGLEFRLTSTPSSWLGTIEYTFTWDGFAVAGDSVIYVGDAFVDGFFLESNSALYIKPPQGYTITQASPQADAFTQGAAVWFGSINTDPGLGMRIFNSGFPQASMESTTVSTTQVMTTASSTTVTSETTTTQDVFEEGLLLIFGGIGGILVFIIVTAALATRNRKKKLMELPGDRELLLTLLHQAGGQAYQSDLVTATGFSAAKISLMIKDLHREGVIVKIRRGNRNIIRLR